MESGGARGGFFRAGRLAPEGPKRELEAKPLGERRKNKPQVLRRISSSQRTERPALSGAKGPAHLVSDPLRRPSPLVPLSSERGLLPKVSLGGPATLSSELL